MINLFNTFNFSKNKFQFEENSRILDFSKQGKISKELEVFFNPEMKLNRDLTILIIKSYFTHKEKIVFCDGLIGSGIREIRLLKTIPEKFEKMYLGDISKTSVKNFKKNLKFNKLKIKNKTTQLEIKHRDFKKLLSENYFDFIEVDPFGSPTQFLDLAFQKVKQNGIISITATDTATLSSKYPKTLFRRYKINQNQRTFCDKELSIRHLISYCVKLAGTYEKSIEVVFSYSKIHYIKIFLKVYSNKTKSLEDIKNLNYLTYDEKKQIFEKTNNSNEIGKTFYGNMNDKNLIKLMLKNINLIEKNQKQVLKLLNYKLNEFEIFGFIQVHKFCKSHKTSLKKNFENIFIEVEKLGYQISKVYENDLGIKTNCPRNKLIKILKN
jgi:tRNA (guanine26-N2/guanine27-N2)-dimethyltransferase